MAVPTAVHWTAPFMPEQSLLREQMKEAKAGDLGAFEQIVIQHERLVLRIAQRLLSNADDARDAAQEVFIRLYRSLRQFNENQEFLPWLYRMTVNVSHDYRRRQKKALTLAPADTIFHLRDTARTPEESASLAQERQLVIDALDRLSERERDAIVLRDLEGLSTGEVASILGSSETTVRSQISLGRAKLRQYLAGSLRRGV